MRITRILAMGVLALAALAGTGAALTWAPDRPVDSLKARWAPWPSRFVEIEGMAVHLRDEGPRTDATPIVLLHGTSASLHTWDGWVDALMGERRIIRIDLPGFGLTGPTPDGDYRLVRYSRFVGALLDELGLKQVVLAGNSFGGQVAWKFAADAPDRVARLVLVDAAGYPFKPESVPAAFRMARIPVLEPLMTYTLPRGVVESSVRNVYGDPDRVTPELVDRYYELALRAGNRGALVQRFRQTPGGEFAEQIPQLKVPTLILWGGRDRLIPLENGQRFASEIAGSKLVVFDALGHVPHEEDPAATVEAVKGFLAH